MDKKIPFSKKFLEDFCSKNQTPFHVYDKKQIEKNLKDFLKAFSWNKGFREYFAVKATPNPKVLKIFKENDCGMDCSSMAELLLCQKMRIKGEKIMFTSNETPLEEYKKAIKLNAIINIDDISHIDLLEENNLMRKIKYISFRYNPGNKKSGNVIIGDPIEAKFGLTEKQIFLAYEKIKNYSFEKIGIHTMVCSNELKIDYFVDTCKMMFELTKNISKKVGIKFDFINLGGGLGIPYNLGEKKIDMNLLSLKIKKLYDKNFKKDKPALLFESGRYMTGPFGYLISKVVHKKDTYKNYVGLDATMANLMRPGMYGAYHHIEVLGKEKKDKNKVYDIVGSLCENNDKFAINRKLPEIEIGDICVIFDAGAHGHSMGFNYNGKLRSSEYLYENNKMKKIRRAETYKDLFRTLI